MWEEVTKKKKSGRCLEKCSYDEVQNLMSCLLLVRSSLRRLCGWRWKARYRGRCCVCEGVIIKGLNAAWENVLAVV